MWHLYFADGYWLPNLPKFYFENPPLMIWLEATFFYVFGDHWWTEKLFSLFVYASTALAMFYLWQQVSRFVPTLRNHALLAVVCWVLIPVSNWSTANNMMDNVLLFWIVLTTAFMLRYVYSHSRIFGVWAGCTIFLGILSKGPVALYPLAIPILLCLVMTHLKFWDACIKTIIPTFVAVGLFFLLCILNEDAFDYFRTYWEQRLQAVIIGTRQDMALHGIERLSIVKDYLMEGSLTFAFMVAAYLYKPVPLEVRKWSGFFILLGLCGMLPIIISTKQSNIYLVPSMPMLSFALAIIISGLDLKVSRFWYRLSFIGFILIGVLGLGVFFHKWGSLGRDYDQISSIHQISKIIPARTTICMNNQDHKDFRVHGYMQRMAKLSIKPYRYSKCTYFLAPSDSIVYGFEPILKTKKWFIYKNRTY
jgi:4-amino-4-deoxy-L-arabinose transferase-like glycosyltransferase